MDGPIERFKQFILGNRILIALTVIAISSIAVLFATLTGENGSNSGDTSTQTARINTDAQKMDDLNLPKAELEKIKTSVQQLIRKNNSSDVDLGGAIVRSKSVKTKTFDGFNLAYINFIIDLPNQKQSYQVSHEWSEDEKNQYLTKEFSAQSYCLRDDKKIKYKDFNCRDYSKQDPKYTIAKNYARFDLRDDAEIIFSQDDPTALTVASFSYSEEKEQQLINYAEEWIESLGFSADGFSITAAMAGGGAPDV